MPPRRRTSDAIRAVDGLVFSHLQRSPVDTRALANLAVAMASEYSGATRAALLLDRGQGALIPCFALGPELSPAPIGPDSYDAALVAAAVEGRRLAGGADRLAAPILLAGEVRGAIYLESADSRLGPDARELVTAVAARIAQLLHSATLVEDAARRARNVETLEALGECLSAGVLSDEHLGRAADAALHATASTHVLLGLIDPDGRLLDLHVRGVDRDRLEKLAGSLAAAALEGGPAPDSPGEAQMFEPLQGDLLRAAEGRRDRPPLGFLAVRRPAGREYAPAERSFFRALAHLLAGALARLAYFRQASEDTLTGAASRLALDVALVQSLDRAEKTGQPLALMLIDVDRFKEVNDTHGHLLGDEMLAAVADLIRSRLRAADFLARYGGDEFVVLLPETGEEDAARLAEDLRARVAATELTSRSLRSSLSIGIGHHPRNGRSPRELLDAADRALYESKRAGRNRVTSA